MDYRLIVLTHGRSETLGRCLDSFHASVTPAPSDVFVYCDGPPDVAFPILVESGNRRQLAGAARTPLAWTLDSAVEPGGFCQATAECWQAAAASPYEHVLHLEHDFVFNHPVDLRDLRAVLDGNPRVAQCALKRQPVSPEEISAGGYVEMRPHEYEARHCLVGDPPRRVDWLEHRLFMTTNPSLFRAEIARDHPWPLVPNCEGLMGIRLVEQGYRFALYGTRHDPPAVEHIGVRTGHGY